MSCHHHLLKITEVLTFLGVTVQRMLIILLDFSCPSWGFFLRNRRLLLQRKESHGGYAHSQCLLFIHIHNCCVNKEPLLFT